jgi:glycine dehydrogenase subunit 2
MIEPTETEPKERLDEFCDAMLAIAREAATDPDLLHAAPHLPARHPARRGEGAKRSVVKYGFEDHPSLATRQ